MKPKKIIMLVKAIVALVLIAASLAAAWAVFRGSVWHVLTGVLCGAIGFTLMESSIRMYNYEQYKKRNGYGS